MGDILSGNAQMKFHYQCKEFQKQVYKTRHFFCNTERQTLSKIKEYAHNNLFEITPAEMDHSMLLMDLTHLDKLINKLSQFDDQTLSLQNTMKSQWKFIYQQLEESIMDIISQIGQNNLDFIQPNIQESPQEQIQITNLNKNLLKNQQQQQQQQQQNINLQTNLDFQRLSLQNVQNYSKQINQQQQYNSSQAYLYQQLHPQPSQNSQHSQSLVNIVSTLYYRYINEQLLYKHTLINNYQITNYNQIVRKLQLRFQIDLKNILVINDFPSEKWIEYSNLWQFRQKSLKNITQTNNNSINAYQSKELQNNSNAKGNSHNRQTSPNGVNYLYQSDGKQLENRKNANHVQSLNSSTQKQQQSFDRRLSAQKIQNTQFSCNYNNMKCIHNDLSKASPVFSCCNWAFPCYECHDMISTHKAYITVPSQRFCQNCHEIFSINLMSTVDVKCYKCQ